MDRPAALKEERARSAARQRRSPCRPSPAQGGAGARLLQVARSTPGVLCALVGHKERDHVEGNLALALEAPLGEAAFASVAARLQGAATA